jgi:MFS transporter, DHA1 family, tetracycline resistance protein
MKKPKQSRNALVFIFITVLIDMAGFGIIMPILPDLIRELTGKDLAGASYYAGMLMLAFAGMQFLCAPLVGNLSDRFGRRPVLLLSLAGFSINYALMAFAPTLIWLFLGRLVAGAFGATFSTAGAFIADVSPPEKRAANFGLIGAAFGVGFIIGPVLGGVLAQYGIRTPFLAAAVLALLNLLYGLFVLPETLVVEKRRKFEWRRANPLGAFTHLQARPVVMAMAWVMLFFGIAHQVYPSVWAFYTQEKFNWTPLDIGLSLGVVGLVFGLSQALVTRWAIPRFGEVRSALIGLVVMMLTYTAYALVTAGWQLYVVIVASFLSALIGPAIQGIMSNRTSESEQGELQGALASIGALGAIIGPVLFTGLFGMFGEKNGAVYFPGAPFAGAALLAALALIGFGFAVKKMNAHPRVAE